MPATFVTAGSTAATSTTSAVIPLPASLAVGNTLVAFVFFHIGGVATVNITPPAGWTTVAVNQYTSAPGRTLGVYTRIVTASEPASYTWTTSPAGLTAGIIAQYTSAAADGDATKNSAGSFVAAWSTTAFTAGHAGDTVLVCAASGAGTTSTATPTGTTAQASVSTGTGGFQVVAALFDIVEASTAVPSLGASWTNPAYWTTAAVALVTVNNTAATLALGPLTLAATGNPITFVVGTATVTLGPLTLASQALLVATASLPLGPVTLTASGVPLNPSTGLATLALGPLTLAAGGLVTGTASLPLGPVTLRAAQYATVTTTVALGPLTVAAVGLQTSPARTAGAVRTLDRPLVYVTVSDQNG